MTSTLHSSLFRWCAAIALLLVWDRTLVAQVKTERTFEFHFTGAISDLGEKLLMEGLVAQDPAIQWWVDRPTQSALVRTHSTLDAGELGSHIAPSGLVIGAMIELVNGPYGATVRIGADDFPHYVDTGDPSHDAPAFIEAKAAWFGSHTTAVPTFTDH